MLPDDVVETRNSFNDTQRLKFIDAITSCNCYLVKVSPVASACFRCNTNAPNLDSSEQARAVLFYLLKYITKAAMPLAQAVAMAAAARGHIDVYPSVADDCHSADWRAMYFVQRLTNRFTGLTEVCHPRLLPCFLEWPLAQAQSTPFFALSGMPFIIRIH